MLIYPQIQQDQKYQQTKIKREISKKSQKNHRSFTPSLLTQNNTSERLKFDINSTEQFMSIHSLASAATHCDSQSITADEEYISRIQLNTIDNVSGGQTYTDFTSVSTTLIQNAEYTITITPVWVGTIYDEAYSVWIDYNGNCDFTDPGEQVFIQAPTQTTPIIGSFTIPSDAIEGPTRMRISMNYNAIPTSCQTFTYGEVEDYTVIIEAPIPDVEPPTAPTNLVGSNITSTSVDLTWDASTDNVEVTRYDVYQDDALIASVASTGYQVTGLSPFTNYDFYVIAMDEAGNASSASNIESIVTLELPSICSNIIGSYPYTEGFEGSVGLWTQSTSDDLDWIVNSDGTPSPNTGPNAAIEGSDYIYVEASNNGTGYPNKQAILTSPCYDLSALNEAYFSFFYHMFGSSLGSLTLEITIDNGNNWTTLFNVSGSQSNQWNYQNIDLSPYLGETVVFRFIGLTGNSWRSDIALDFIRIDELFVPYYCESNGNNTDEEYISRVQLNTIDNSSGEGTTSIGYSNFTNLSTELYAGTEYTITITPTWTGTIYDEAYSVWIDFNFDGDFNDPGEQVFTQEATQDPTVSGGFTIPDDIAFEEQTRMRVSMKFNDIPDTCESFTYGEVEDYSINLKYNGLIFKDNNWIPNSPSDVSGSEDALIFNGTYVLNSDIELSNLNINTRASIEVPESYSITLNENLENNGDFILNSTSDQYSSLIVLGNVSGDVIYNRHVNINTAGNDLISAPVTGEIFESFASRNTNLYSNPSNPSEKLFGPFDKTSETYLTWDTDVPLNAAELLNPGIGYRSASVDDDTFSFIGTVNTETITVDIFNSGTTFPEWNLVGNPYPSYITLSDFLNTNLDEFLPETAAIYGYDGNASDGWKIWNRAYSLANPDAKLAPGQGFLVPSREGGGVVTFTSGMRTIGSDDDFIDGRNTSITNLSIQLTRNRDVYTTDFYFLNSATPGLDVGYDAAVFNGVAPGFAIYSRMIQDNEGKDIAIQSLGYDIIEQQVAIPLGINASQGQQLRVSIVNNNLPEDVDIYLEDNVLNTFTLLNQSDYIFSTETAISGEGRFYLRFESETLASTEYELNDLLIFTQDNPNSIVIKGRIIKETSLEIYDVKGRLITTSILRANSAINTINTDNFSSGIYIISLESDDSYKTQKLIVK